MARPRKLKETAREISNVIGYVRVSTDKQAESGAGLGSQRGMIERECTNRRWNLVRIATDEGLSGKDINRPALTEALEDLRLGRADALVVAKLDRLSRSVKDFAHILDLSGKQGWKLIVLDVAVDTSTPSGELMVGVMSQFAQFERKIISQRTKDALAVIKAQGKTLGRRPEVSDEATALIKKMRKGGATLAGISETLNEKGFQTARGGSMWYPSTIQRVLDREV